MLFETPQPLPIVSCSVCHTTGMLGWRRCGTCYGLGSGLMTRGRLHYFGYPLDRYHIALFHSRILFNKLRKVTAAIAGVMLWVWAGIGLYSFLEKTPFVPGSSLLVFVKSLPLWIPLLVWFGVIIFSYLVYRFIAEEPVVATVERRAFNEVEPGLLEQISWVAVPRIPMAKRFNIAESFSPEALQALGMAYTTADGQSFNKVNSYHLLHALLSIGKIRILFIRLGLPVKTLQDLIIPLFSVNNSKTGGKETAPVVGEDVEQIIYQAYEEAYRSQQGTVGATELFLAAVKMSSVFQDILFDFEIDKNKLVNAIEWARIRERLYQQYKQFSRAARHRSKHGMDRAMTAVATPYLNQFSEDVTLAAQFGRTTTCIAREKELQAIFQVVEGGQNSVLLVGDYGVGKKTIIEGIAELMVEEKVPPRLSDKRMVRLSISSLLAGTTPAGAVERLENSMYEISRAGNIIVCINNIQELIGVSAGGRQSLDVASTLAEYLSAGRFLTIATTTTEAYAQTISNSKLSSVFSRVTVPEMDENQAIQVLESKVGYLEYKHNVFYTYNALEKAVQLAKRFLRETTLPGSALEILSEAGSYTKNKKGADAMVTGEEVGAVVANKTHIPVTSITADESTKLMHLEEQLHERVVGQDEAVTLVANALRRARAEIRSQSRPIANFLFLGPTGVGKTELAKTIAEVYFGGESRMIRFDMSEYQDKASLYRLIGTPNEKGTGLLTEAVKNNPFALLLLDEIEKADRDVLNIFLQVMDDGRLTDSTGRVIDFTNVIIIATSNAGTSYVQEQMRAGLSSDVIKDRLLHGELKDHFRPEFLNRFDGIVLFKPLEVVGIKKIAGLMLQRVARDLEVKGIALKVDDAALDFFAKVGFDPEFGARPLRRALQERVENQLAELLLTGKVGRRDAVTLGAEGRITVGSR